MSVLNRTDASAVIANPGEAAFHDLKYFCLIGEPPSFPLAVHETYKENNQQ